MGVGLKTEENKVRESSVIQKIGRSNQPLKVKKKKKKKKKKKVLHSLRSSLEKSELEFPPMDTD